MPNFNKKSNFNNKFHIEIVTSSETFNPIPNFNKKFHIKIVTNSETFYTNIKV